MDTAEDKGENLDKSQEMTNSTDDNFPFEVNSAEMTNSTDDNFPFDVNSTAKAIRANFLHDSNSTDPMSTLLDYYLNYSEDYSATMEQMCEPNKNQEIIAMAVQVTLFLIVFFLGVMGNGLVIATFTKYRRLRLRCMTNVFLFYLALSDLLLLLTLPLQTAEVIRGGWVFKDGLCKLNQGIYAINTYSGLLLLACISIDRYLVVVRARAAQRLRPDMLLYSILSAVAVALTSVLLSLPELLFSAEHREVGKELGRCGMYIWLENNGGWVKKLAYVAKITGFCVPCVAMLVCYGAIGNMLIQGGGKCWRRQRTLRLMGALVLLFLLFQLPYTVVMSFRMFGPMQTCEAWDGAHLSENVTRSLAYIRCCLNPVLYALVGVRFRNDVMRLLQDCGCRCACLSHLTPHSENGSSITPSSPAHTILSPLPTGYKTTAAELQVIAKDSPSSNVFLYPTTTYVSWGQH